MKEMNIKTNFSYNEFLFNPIVTKEPPFSLKLYRKIKKNHKFLFEKKIYCIIIQTYARKYLAKKYVKNLRQYQNNHKYKLHFETIEKSIKFNFSILGAVLFLQSFIRKCKYMRNYYKKCWKLKYKRYYNKQKSLKILYNVFQRIGKPIENFHEDNFYDNNFINYASSILIQKNIRGYFGRKRYERLYTYVYKIGCIGTVPVGRVETRQFQRILRDTNERKFLENTSATRIQSFFLRISFLLRNESIGWILQRKKRLFASPRLYNGKCEKILIREGDFLNLIDKNYCEDLLNDNKIETFNSFFTNFKLLINNNNEFCQLNNKFEIMDLTYIEENLSKIISSFLQDNQYTSKRNLKLTSLPPPLDHSSYNSHCVSSLKENIYKSFLILPDDFISSLQTSTETNPSSKLDYFRSRRDYIAFSSLRLEKFLQDSSTTIKVNNQLIKFQSLFKKYKNRLSIIKKWKEKVSKKRRDAKAKIIKWILDIKRNKQIRYIYEQNQFAYDQYLIERSRKIFLINKIIKFILYNINLKKCRRNITLKMKAIKFLQKSLLHLLFLKRFRVRLVKKRINNEYQENNKYLFYNTFYYYYTKNLWEANKKKAIMNTNKSRMEKDKNVGEINKLFIIYSFNDGIELTKILKIFNTIFDTFNPSMTKSYIDFYSKHDDNLGFYLSFIEKYNNFEDLSQITTSYSSYLQTYFNPTILEKLFHKSKANSQDKRLTYDGFLTFLSYVSLYYFLGIEATKDFWVNKGIDLELDDLLELNEGDKFSIQKSSLRKSGNGSRVSSRPSSRGSSRSNSPKSRASSPSTSRPHSPSPNNSRLSSRSRPISPLRQRGSRPSSPLKSLNSKLEVLSVHTRNYLKNKYFSSNNRNLNFLIKNKIKLRELNITNFFNYYKTHPISFHFGSLVGRESWVIKFYEKFLIRTPDIIKINDYLNKKSSLRITINFLVGNIRRIQKFYRFYLLRKNLKRIYNDYLDRELMKEQNRASKVITNFFKFFLIKKSLIERSLKVYSKFIDYNTEKVYYYNNNSKESSWDKPKFLYDKDCSNVVVMPQRHELFTISCDICLQSYVSLFCKSCVNFYCLNCFTISHRSGLRLKHEKINISICSLCDIQVATRYCYNCQENCCDYCYNYYHKSGRLRYHSYKNYYKVCTICNEFTGQWFEYFGSNYIHNKNHPILTNGQNNSDPNEFQVKFNNKFDTFNELFFSLNCNNFDYLYIPSENISSLLSFNKKNNSVIYKEIITKEKFMFKCNQQVNKLWCTRCYSDYYKEHPQERIASQNAIEEYQEKLNSGEILNQMLNESVTTEESNHLVNLNQSSLEKIQFYGELIEKYFYLKKKEFESQRINHLYNDNQSRILSKKKDVSIVLLQRIYRGYICRKKIVSFLEERKKFFELRKNEINKKDNILYKIKNYFGVAPILLSDTPLEKINKMYPKYYRKIIEECLDNNWTYGCELVRQHDEILRLYNSSPFDQNISKILEKDLKEQEQIELEKENISSEKIKPGENEIIISTSKSVKSERKRSKISNFKSFASVARINDFSVSAKSNMVIIKGTSLLKIFLIKAKIYYYKNIFDMLYNKIQVKKFNLEILSINYYHAEESGIYSLNKLKTLKKNLLKNEKTIKNLLAKYDNMHKIIKKLENNIIQYVGPRFLQNLIKDCQKNGKILPIKLNLKKNSRVVTVVYPTKEELDEFFSVKYSPLKKKNEILEFYYEEFLNKNSSKDEIEENEEDLFSRGNFTESMINKQESKEDIEVKNDNKSDFLNEYNFIKRNLNFSKPGSWRKLLREGDYILINGVQYKVCRTIPSKKDKKIPNDSRIHPMGIEDEEMSLNISDDDSEFSNLTDDDEESSSKKEKIKKQNEENKEIITEDNIILDHPWMLDDIENVTVYKTISSLFYMKPMNFLSRQFKRSYPIQKFIAINSINSHYIGKFWEKLSILVDENSSLYQVFLKNSSYYYKTRDEWLQRSYKKVTLNYDFELRKVFTNSIKFIMKNFIYDNLKLSMSMLKFFIKDSIKEESSFDYWNRSLKKKLIQCDYELSSNKTITLGDISMDTMAPCEVMREYICRRFRVKLNETIGESFVFIRFNNKTKKEEFLKRDDEFKTHSRDFIEHKLNNITFIHAQTVSIRKDKERGRVFIQALETDETQDDIKDIEIDDLLKA